MSIKSELEKLISQGWFGKVTGRTEGKFFDQKEDVDNAVNKAHQAILAEVEKAVSIKPEQLHIWYLEATKKLSPDSYNEKAQVDYEFLSNEQQYIDEYIADKIKDDIKAKLHSEGL